MENIAHICASGVASVIGSADTHTLEVALNVIEFAWEIWYNVYLLFRPFLRAQRFLVDNQSTASVVTVLIGHRKDARFWPTQLADTNADESHGASSAEYHRFAPVGQKVSSPPALFRTGGVDLHVPFRIGFVVGDDGAIIRVKEQFVPSVDDTATTRNGIHP